MIKLIFSILMLLALSFGVVKLLEWASTNKALLTNEQLVTLIKTVVVFSFLITLFAFYLK